MDVAPASQLLENTIYDGLWCLVSPWRIEGSETRLSQLGSWEIRGLTGQDRRDQTAHELHAARKRNAKHFGPYCASAQHPQHRRWPFVRRAGLPEAAVPRFGPARPA